MRIKYQKGELSLLWSAVFVGVVALAAMIALMSARFERNYFAEAWKKFTKSDAGQVLQQTQQSAGNAVKGEAAVVRKCVIDGKVIYSNVECKADSPGSRKVDLQDTKGFEAPKVSAPAPGPEGAPNLREKMIEQAVKR